MSTTGLFYWRLIAPPSAIKMRPFEVRKFHPNTFPGSPPHKHRLSYFERGPKKVSCFHIHLGSLGFFFFSVFLPFEVNLGVFICFLEMGTESLAILHTNGFFNTGNESERNVEDSPANGCVWFEEQIDDDLKWSFTLERVLDRGTSAYQQIALLDTKRFGKVLLIDGKMQSAEKDEFIYHECLIHPPLLCHPNPKTVFIMGGGEGSAAREALKHLSIEEVVMCDIDQEVVDFCKKHLTENREAFSSKKLKLVINDAKAELENRKGKFDIIVGDLADPVEGGPCYQLYTKSFYEKIIRPKLNKNGIFVTQAGPAGIFTHKEVFSSIYNTIKQVFKYVIPYTAHVPSFADTWGWVMASDEPFSVDAKEIDRRIEKRIDGDLLYLNGASFLSLATLNKMVLTSLLKETHVYTEEDARFIHGHGVAYRC